MLKLITSKIKRRPFPLNFTALQACRVSYSQFGEDLFLTGLLGYEKTDGVYVDVGCFRPILYSNTYIFYQRGWRGVTIDPNPAFKKEWARYRPEDTFVNFAISKESKKMAYLMNDKHPAANAVVDEDQISQYDPNEYKVSSCEAAPLSDILDRHLKGDRIDLLSIDCEGRDLEVLATLDFSKRRPCVIAIEDLDFSFETKTTAYLQSLNYKCMAYMGFTKIFQRKE